MVKSATYGVGVFIMALIFLDTGQPLRNPKMAVINKLNIPCKDSIFLKAKSDFTNEKQADADNINVMKLLSLQQAINRLHTKNIAKTEAAMLFESILLNQEKFKLSEANWIQMLQLSLKLRLEKCAVQVFTSMIKLGIGFKSSSFTDLITLLSGIGSFTEALRVFDLVISSGYKPTVHNFSPMLKASGSTYRAKEVLRRMKLVGVDANVVSFSAAIKSCEGTGNWESALELLDLMHSYGIEPNEITYCCVISVCAKGNAGDVAIHVLREMQSVGLPPNQLCYSSAINACARSGMWVEVESLLHEIRDIGITLRETTLLSVIIYCKNTWTRSAVRRVDGDEKDLKTVVTDYLDDANVNDLTPWQRVLRLLHLFTGSVVDLSCSLFVVAMDVLESHNQQALVIPLFRTITRKGLQPTNEVIRHVVSACALDLDGDNALIVTYDALCAGLESSSLYNATTLICYRSGRHAELIRVLLEVIRRMNTSSRKTIELRSSKLSPAKVSDSTVTFDFNATQLMLSAVEQKWNKFPSPWITRNILSSTLEALTKNFSHCFTEIVDGRMGPSADVADFVADVTVALNITALDKQLRLTDNSYPMANKLLLDAGDYGTLRVLLNHTLSMEGAGSGRLYDFAIRSFKRLSTADQAVENLLWIIEDLSQAGNHRMAKQAFMEGIRLISVKTSDMYMDHHKNTPASVEHGNILRSDFIDDNDVGSFRSKRRDFVAFARQQGKMMHKFFKAGRAYLRETSDIPNVAYRIAAHSFKYAGMLDLMLETYNQALEDGVSDAQLKNLVIYNLAQSRIYWDTALDILSKVEQKPDLFMYTSGLIACETGEDWENALYLIKRIRQDGYNLTTAAMASAISTCASCGRVIEALQLLEFMESNGIARSIPTFNSVIVACSKVGRWQDALKTFEKMRLFAAACSGSEGFAAQAAINSQGVEASIGPLSVASALKDKIEAAKRVVHNSKENLISLSQRATTEKSRQDLDKNYELAMCQGLIGMPYHRLEKGFVDLQSYPPKKVVAATRYCFDWLLEAALNPPTSQMVKYVVEQGEEDYESSDIHDHLHVWLRVKFSMFLEAAGLISQSNSFSSQSSMMKSKGFGRPKDLVIQANTRDEKMVQAMVQFLRNSYGISCTVGGGRITVPGKDIMKWINSQEKNVSPDETSSSSNNIMNMQ